MCGFLVYERGQTPRFFTRCVISDSKNKFLSNVNVEGKAFEIEHDIADAIKGLPKYIY